jgi:hypothetical protein
MESRGITDTFDGAAIVWTETDPAKLKMLDPAKATAAGATCLQDEKLFLDLPSSCIFTSEAAYSEGGVARPAAANLQLKPIPAAARARL